MTTTSAMTGGVVDFFLSEAFNVGLLQELVAPLNQCLCRQLLATPNQALAQLRPIDIRPSAGLKHCFAQPRYAKRITIDKSAAIELARELAAEPSIAERARLTVLLRELGWETIALSRPGQMLVLAGQPVVVRAT